VAYLPNEASTTLDLSKVRGAFTARWFNPRTGTFGEAFSVSGEVERKIDAPDANDWVLVLEATLK
jgi:hypothetical protein